VQGYLKQWRAAIFERMYILVQMEALERDTTYVHVWAHMQGMSQWGRGRTLVQNWNYSTIKAAGVMKYVTMDAKSQTNKKDYVSTNFPHLINA